MTAPAAPAPARMPIGDLVAYFLKLGALGFGGQGRALDQAGQRHAFADLVIRRLAL